MDTKEKRFKLYGIDINLNNLKKAYIYTFLFGILAHGYGFLNFQLSHDSLKEAVVDSAYKIWKVQLGRYLVVAYKYFLGYFSALPWTQGLSALFWIAMSSCLIVEIFQLKKNIYIAIVCGILTTNITVISLTATYIEDLSADMCALFFAVLAVYFWTKAINVNLVNKKQIIIYGTLIALCLAISLALYQAYISVFVTLVIMVTINKVIFEYSINLKKIIVEDFFAVIALSLAGSIYFIILKLVLLITNISLSDSYNSVSNAWTNKESIKIRIIATYKQYIKTFLKMEGYPYSHNLIRIINVILIFLGMVFFVTALVKLKNKDKTNNSTCFMCNYSFLRGIVALICVMILPLAMNLMRMLNSTVHDLMIYAFWLTYIFILLLLSSLKKNINFNILEKLTIFLMVCVIVTNVQTANVAYVKKTTEQQATLSLMTRVIDKVEDLDGYKVGITPVAFIGLPEDYLIAFEPFYKYEGMTGMEENSQITHYNVYQIYFSMLLKVDLNVVDEETEAILSEEDAVKAMPTFPNKGSIQMLDDLVIVKFK